MRFFRVAAIVIPFGGRLQAPFLALFHVVIVLCSSRARRRVRRQPTRPLRNIFTHAVGKLRIDGRAAGQTAGEGRGSKQKRKAMVAAGHLWHMSPLEHAT